MNDIYSGFFSWLFARPKKDCFMNILIYFTIALLLPLKTFCGFVEDSLLVIDCLHNVSIQQIPENKITMKRYNGAGMDNRLHILFLHGIQMDSFPTGLLELNGLYQLGLDSCGLKSLPDSLQKLSRLQTLFCRDNKLITLPDAISKMDSLNNIVVSNCNISFLPPSILNRTILQRVSHGYPGCINNCFKLEPGLVIDNNKLCNVTTTFKNWLDTNAGSQWQSSQLCGNNVVFNGKQKQTDSEKKVLERLSKYSLSGRIVFSQRKQKHLYSFIIWK